MPLRSVIVHASLPRVTLAVISPSKVKLAYEERISRPLSLKFETVVSFAMRIPWVRRGPLRRGYRSGADVIPEIPANLVPDVAQLRRWAERHKRTARRTALG